MRRPGYGAPAATPGDGRGPSALELLAAVGALAGISAITLALVYGTARLVAAKATASAYAFVHPLVLGACAVAMLPRLRRQAFGSRPGGAMDPLPVLIPLAFVAAAGGSGVPGVRAGLPVLIVQAGVEELAFRSVLPAAGLALLRRIVPTASPGCRVVLAALASQLSFSLAHLASGWGSTGRAPGLSADHLVRLAIAGLLLQVMAWLFGLGVTTCLHAGLNVLILYGVGLPTEPLHLTGAGLAGASAIAYIWRFAPRLLHLHLHPRENAPGARDPLGHGGSPANGGAWRRLERVSVGSASVWALGQIIGSAVPFVAGLAVVCGWVGLSSRDRSHSPEGATP